MRDERPAERAAVARLQHRRLDLDEALRSRGSAGSRATIFERSRNVCARLLVHQQVEVAAGDSAARRRSGRGTCRAAASGCARAARARRRSARARRGGSSSACRSRRRCRRGGRRPRPCAPAGQSSWMRPLRSTRSRKTSFPMSRRAITRPASRRVLGAFDTVLERVRLGANGGDLVAVREPLRRRGHERLDHSPGPRALFRRVPLALDREAVRLVEAEVRLVVRQQHGRQPGARRGASRPGWSSAAPIALALRRRVDADARRGTSAARTIVSARICSTARP